MVGNLSGTEISSSSVLNHKQVVALVLAFVFDLVQGVVMMKLEKMRV
jgi:hypothetical protein